MSFLMIIMGKFVNHVVYCLPLQMFLTYLYGECGALSLFESKICLFEYEALDMSLIHGLHIEFHYVNILELLTIP